jgi:hypothetical protein
MMPVVTTVPKRKLQTSKKDDDRRATTRRAVKTPVEYRISGSTPQSGWKRGQTLDMSASGILVDIPGKVTVGSTVELGMDWPGLYYRRSTVWLLLTASVVRNDCRGTALRILRHEFRDVRPAMVGPRNLAGNRAVA